MVVFLFFLDLKERRAFLRSRKLSSVLLFFEAPARGAGNLFITASILSTS
jgi:hypothetical protein